MRHIVRRIQKTYQMAGPQESKLVLRNVAFLSGLQAITYILPVIVLPYLFRTIGPDKFGLVAFAQALVQYFIILTDYGFSITATREISICANEQVLVRKVFCSVMVVKTFLTLISLSILGALIYLIPKFKKDDLLYLLSFGVVIGNTLFPIWFFQGMEKMKYIANLNIFGELLYAGCIFYFVRGPQDYLMVPLVTSFAALTTGLLGQYIVFRTFKMRFEWPRLSSLAEQFKVGWNIFLSVVAINAYTTTRIFAVGLLTNNTVTGFYSIAEKIANVAQTFPLSSFSQAIFPRLSHIFHRNKTKAFQMMHHIQMVTTNIALIILPVIFFFSSSIVKLVCGHPYPQVALVLRLLLVAVLFISANAFRVQFLLVCGKTSTYSKIHITMAIIGLPLILVLIWRFSYLGAAMATVLIEAGTLTLTYMAVRKLPFGT